ncbi:hypothetical protein [Caldiplasma sukawensis]
MDTQGSSDPMKPLIDNMESDIKALLLYADRDQEISRLDIIKRLEESNEESTREFLNLVRRRESRNEVRLIIATFGEFVLSVFLFIIGILMIIPTFYEINPSYTIFSYYYSILKYSYHLSGLIFLPAVINFLISIILILSGVTALRNAKDTIRKVFR